MFEKFRAKVVMLKGEPGASGDYNGQTNKPQINGLTLVGNKTAAQLGLASASQMSNLASRISQILANDTSEYAGIDLRTYTSEPATMTYDSALGLYAVKQSWTVPAGAVILEAAWSYSSSGTAYSWKRDDLRVSANGNTVTLIHTHNGSSAPVFSFVLRLTVAVSVQVDLSELIDLRVGVDGYVYQDAGDAVRSQLEALQQQISNLSATVQSLSANENR